MPHTILIVDDEDSIRISLRGILEDESYEVLEASSGEEALEILKHKAVSTILLDIWMEGMDGIETLSRIKHTPQSKEDNGEVSAMRDIPVIIMSGHGTVETAVSATKIGAYDFLEKPLSLDRVLILLERAIQQLALTRENRNLKAQMAVSHTLVGKTPIMTALDGQIARVAPTNSWVLITGENGTGKEVAARRIHSLSNRSDKPFIPVNSAAIPEALIESELFGHEKGALPGTQSVRIGHFERANNGTLFLDEIGDMSLTTQAKILRILQEQRFERVGGSEQIHVNVRVIAASNKELKEEIAEGRFRQDLFFRLNVVPLHMPPLLDRLDDIEPLVTHFVQLHKGNLPQHSFSPEAIKKLKTFTWPGNVRELKNLVERLLIMASGPIIQPEDLDGILSGQQNNGEEPDCDLWNTLIESGSLREAREAFERAYLAIHLERNNGNISRTAEVVHMERSALHRKLKSLGVN
ncbi:MAG: sigma-54-dependent Fis family transcriptional regulator [Magnetococcales bacterium]|nr:sigma-54-dependent Fis family transcriptional regulator [Magnetococcales bacterium]